MRKSFVQIGGKLYEKGVDMLPERKSSNFQIMPDIKPYKSMIDGTMITSRSQHREHLRAHGCVEVGNDSSLYRQPKPLQPPPGLKDRLIENARLLRSK